MVVTLPIRRQLLSSLKSRFSEIPARRQSPFSLYEFPSDRFTATKVVRGYLGNSLSQTRTYVCHSLIAMDHEKQFSKSTEGTTIRCRAAVCRAAGEPLAIEEIMVAPPMPSEVRIKVICTSLCHTDVSGWKRKGPLGMFPRILGHEAVGVVESVGKDVNEVRAGDVVIPSFLSECEECADCRSEKSNLCSKIPFKISPWMPRHETSRFTDLNGKVLHHFMFVSSFSEYTVVDIAHLTKIDPTIPPDRACLLSCGVSTGVGGAWRKANVQAGSTVAIFGLGTIGLAVAEGARLCGASKIIGVDLNSDKFEMGKKFGVTDFVHAGKSTDTSVSEKIMKMTGGVGADYCFECVGMTSLVQEAYLCCRKGWGKTIVLGLDKPESVINLSSYHVLLSGKSLTGCMLGGIKPKSDIPILLKRYKNKELNLDEFVTHKVNFENINEAFELLSGGKCLRCVIWMDKYNDI